VLIEQLKDDQAIAEADPLLLTVPNQMGVAYSVYVMEAILTTVAPALGWRWYQIRWLTEAEPGSDYSEGSLVLSTGVSSGLIR
jgi:hypothetical protein